MIPAHSAGIAREVLTVFKKIIDELLFRTISCDDMPKVKAQIMAENAKYVRVWAIAEMLY